MANGYETAMVNAVVRLEELHILGLVETWRGREDWLRVRRGGEKREETRNLFGEDFIWVEQNRKTFNSRGSRGDGGVGLVVSRAWIGEKGKVKVMRKFCDEDVMWVKVGPWFVCVVYFRPGKKWEESRKRVWRAVVEGVKSF